MTISGLFLDWCQNILGASISLIHSSKFVNISEHSQLTNAPMVVEELLFGQLINQLTDIYVQ